MSDSYDVKCGVKQGCALAPTLFGILFSALLRSAFPDPSGIALLTRSTGRLFNLARMREKTNASKGLVCKIMYADDAAFVAPCQEDLQAIWELFFRICHDLGMKISIRKTVVPPVNTLAQPLIQIDGTPLEVVDKFIYLGYTVTCTNSLDEELNTRIGKAAMQA